MLRSLMAIMLIAGAAALSAQTRDRVADRFGRSATAWCDETYRWNRNERLACDVREASLPSASDLDIDTGGNGGIAVRGVSGSTARIRFRVVAWADSEADARSLARVVEISTEGGRIRARGPRTQGRERWSVDVEVETPRDLPLTLATRNGGISIEDVAGRTRFETANGGVTLIDVAGDLRGSTVNGGMTVQLDGRQWQGEGLDVATTNGGVRMTLPEGYNAELSAETRNGGLSIDFPVTVQGRLTGINRRIVTTLGAGGPRLQVRTVNGGVSIARR